jgi:hypothetical protein
MKFEPNGGINPSGDIVPEGQRGLIHSTSTGLVQKVRSRKPTNKEYAQQHGITTRQASKKRRGY